MARVLLIAVGVFMNRRAVLTFFLFAAWASAQIVPDLFIVEMDEPSGNTRQASVSKQSVRQAVEQRSGQVLDSFSTVMDALVVRMDETGAQSVGAMPGVRKVYRVVEGRLEMDGALPLHHVYDAWSRIGGIENAGKGVRIGIIDTGIDHEHPGLRDESLVAPEGFPKGNRESDLTGTSSKIIVVRSYENLLSAFDTPAPTDFIGHGTAVAMVAAGVRHQAPYAEIAGIAPRAFLGSYKVFGRGGSTRSDVIIRAIEDAVNDGMNIVNLSLGFTPALRASEDAVVRAVERAAEAGVVVAKSMGNAGPEPNTGSSPGAAPSIITAGANWNQRLFVSTVSVSDASPYLALPSDGPSSPEPLQAPLADVAALDGTGLACARLPDGSLSGRIALILRGECLFEDKMNNAQRAGAFAALVYTDAEREIVVMGVGNASLAGMMVTHEDGLKIKAQLSTVPDATAVMRFEGAPFSIDGNRVVSFSSRGPTEANGIAPDLLAAGVEVYTAAQINNPRGEIYDPRGYAIVDGTSFSSPMTAGGMAVVMGARPGLTLRQYRSLLINSASRVPLAEGTAPVQHTGAGLMNVDAALKATATAFPTSVSFGAGGSSADVLRELSITNVGAGQDTFTIAVVPHAGSPEAQMSINSFTLAPKAARSIALRWSHANLEPGEYQGVFVVRGTASDAELRIPYWYAVSTRAPRYLSVFSTPTSGVTNSSQSFNVRVTDAVGVILAEVEPEATVDSGDGFVTSVRSVDDLYPGMYRVTVRLGPFPGPNVFLLRAGDVTRRISIRGN